MRIIQPFVTVSEYAPCSKRGWCLCSNGRPRRPLPSLLRSWHAAATALTCSTRFQACSSQSGWKGRAPCPAGQGLGLKDAWPTLEDAHYACAATPGPHGTAQAALSSHPSCIGQVHAHTPTYASTSACRQLESGTASKCGRGRGPFGRQAPTL